MGIGEVDAFGSPGFEAERFARPLKRARLGVASARRAGDDERNFVRRRRERFERRHRKRTCSQHDQSHANLASSRWLTSAAVRARATAPRSPSSLGSSPVSRLLSKRQFELVQLVLDRGQLRRAEPVDEQLAVEVIGLVLQDAGHQSLGLGMNEIAIQVVRFDFDRRVADHRRSHVGNAQAPFFVLRLSLAFAEHRVDEHELGIFLCRVALRIGDEQPIRQIDLVRRQADAFVVVHQVEHLGDDLPQLGVDLFQRPGDVPQRRMRILDDFEAQGASAVDGKLRVGPKGAKLGL